MNRKSFLKIGAITLTSASVVIWNMMTNRQKQFADKPVETKLNAAKLGTGTYFFDRFIVVKSETGIKIFSNKCTHAGCKINQEVDGQFICPCHGSRYDSSTGKVLQGPAGISLQKVPFKSEDSTGEIIVII